MTSTIAWLDTSADEQRRVRELIALFSEKGTLDELGVGQIRDVFSNALFPGTSTIQTRARYFLLVPWSYRAAARPGRSGAQIRQHAETIERTLVETLRVMPGQSGVIGAQKGAKVKTLPSTIYWNGLLTWGILRRDIAPDGIAADRAEHDTADELVARVQSDWHPTIPAAPDGFPHRVEGGLALTAPEAAWLRERILERVPGTLLAHLVAADDAPDTKSRYPWRDAVCAAASGPAAAALRHAHMFSLVMEGATRLYGVLVAEAYESAGFNKVTGSVEKHRDAYQTWARSVDDERHQLDTWDQDAFWSLIRRQNERVSPRTEQFVQRWVAAVLNGSASEALDAAPAVRQLVAERERSIKRGQARLSNQKLLALWGGGGGGGLDFRWPTVKTIVNDIHEGVSRA